jgi:fatty acid-binding protein DegV
MLKHGEVTTIDQVRTRSKARDRLIELVIEKPVERLSILHSVTPDIDAFRSELLRHLPDIDPNAVSVELVGPSVGPHVGPGCVGAAILYRPS